MKDAVNKENVLFVPIGESYRASSRFRVWQLLPHLKLEGYACKTIPYNVNIGGKHLLGALKRKVYSHFFIEQKIKKELLWADVVVIQEALLSIRLLKYIKKLGIKVVFDFSDPINKVPPNHGRFSLKNLYFRYSTLPRFNFSLALSSCAVIENSLLKESILPFGCEVHVMRGPIDVDWFRPISKPETNQTIIGWTGSPATLKYIQSLFPIIDALGEYYNIKLVLIGAGDVSIDLKNVEVEVVNWTLENERQYVSTFDIGLFNLSNNEWDEFRGGGKLFVYMACGVPFITPDIGIGKQIYEESNAGIKVTNQDEWEAALRKFIEDKSYRYRLAKAAREFAVKSYSHGAYLETWKGILSE